jgi:hypothetical protein
MISNRPTTESPAVPSARFDKQMVAGLTSARISEMTSVEMLDAIALAVMPSETRRELKFQDPQTLKRLVYLARRSCRHQGVSIS